ncbi:MAG: hypothetical protein WBG50_01255 [Desulfomonilaceae bacterium]
MTTKSRKPSRAARGCGWRSRSAGDDTSRSVWARHALPLHECEYMRHEIPISKAVSIIGLIAFLMISLLANVPAQAASGQTTPSDNKVMGVSTPSPPSPIAPYIAQAYSIVGPSYVSTVASQSITLYTGQNDLGIDLTGKNVVVIDQNSKPLTLSAVQKGTRVYVCRKANNVVVMVLPSVTSTGGANK